MKILVLSDLHIPYHHKDKFNFYRAVKKKYKPDRIINIGDEVDGHGLSFHDTDPDLLSPGHELLESRKYVRELEKIFPRMDLVHSNHGSLAYRRAKAKGIPIHYLKSYNEILEVGKGWKWHEELMIKEKHHTLYFRHQFNPNILKATEQMGCCCIQGHYHSRFEIMYTSSPTNLNWGMTVGCGIDDRSLAFEYNRLQQKRPILGDGIIIDGWPRLLPMYMDNKRNWTGEVP